MYFFCWRETIWNNLSGTNTMQRNNLAHPTMKIPHNHWKRMILLKTNNRRLFLIRNSLWNNYNFIEASFETPHHTRDVKHVMVMRKKRIILAHEQAQHFICIDLVASSNNLIHCKFGGFFLVVSINIYLKFFKVLSYRERMCLCTSIHFSLWLNT